MQGCFTKAEGTAAFANADTGTSRPDVDVDVDLHIHVDARLGKYTQTYTKQVDDRSKYMLATDSASLSTNSTCTLVYRYSTFTSTATVGANAIDRSTRRFRRPDLQHPRNA